MRILESHGVDFTTFQLEGMARRWCQSYVLGRPAGSPPLTWGQFAQLFLDRYIPPSEREELRYQIEHLEQGQISVTDYKARFSELSRHALMVLPTDAERVRRFVAGLHPSIRASMAREVEMGTEYQLVVEIARRIEGYRQRGREQIQQDKRARFSGEFRGAPARGRGHFGRGQPSRSPYSAPPPPPRGAPVRPYFSAIPESSYRPPAIQGSFGGYSGPHDSSDSYFSAMPESLYRPPAIQASSSGSTRHQGQPSRQQITAPRGCFECGYLGHMMRYCPGFRGKVVQQGQQPMISAPADPPPRGGGQTGRGRPRGGGQAGRGQPATAQSGGGQPADAPARFYALLADAVITGTIFVGGRGASVLFDPGSTYSYVSSLFARFLARQMVEKGCLAYLAYVRDTTTESPTIDSVLVVREFADVFPSDLPGMPPDRDINFCIDLGTQPVSIPPYRIAPKELKEQLEELLAKGLTQKGDPFRWSDDYKASFQKLKTALTTAPVLVLPSGSGKYTIKARQFNDPHLVVLRETVFQGSAKEISIGEDGVF
ncbi:uncharacterized protein [Nicotiana sylvestris]|uniref:uncharacterized protein n=1 Tax=Nicotiana sylvestris TaxID=4096 RepID=UPI00388C99F0